MPSDLEKFSVFHLPLHLSNDYLTWLIQRLQNRQGTHVVTLNSEMVMLTQKDLILEKIIQKAELVIPDGSGVVMYLLMRGKKQPRCPGIELAQSLIEYIGQNNSGDLLCFYGGQPGVAEAAAIIWQQKLPGLITICKHGYLNPEEQEQWVQTIEKKQPHIILVGLGVPRQELWISENRHRCPNAIWIGVGGSFDIWAGVKTRAPEWLRNNNLEWLYRLYQEPWRWRRMLVLPQFLLKSLIPNS